MKGAKCCLIPPVSLVPVPVLRMMTGIWLWVVRHVGSVMNLLNFISILVR